MRSIHITIRAIGNSKGVVLPKTVLAQAGLENATEAVMIVDNGVIMLRKPDQPVRERWADAARKLASEGGDELLMGEFGNDDDAELAW